MKSGLRRLVVSALIVSLIGVPQVLLAQEKRGANLIVSTKAGPSVAGELIAVRQDSLVLLSPAGKDESVAVGDISTVIIVKKSKAGTGFMIGLLVGGIAGGVLGSKLNEGDPDYETKGAVAGVILFGALAGLIGLGIGAAVGGDDTIDFMGMNEAEAKLELNRLRGMARMRSAQ